VPPFIKPLTNNEPVIVVSPTKETDPEAFNDPVIVG